MLRDLVNNGGPAPTLWCVELVPKKKKLRDADMKRAVQLAKGMPSDPEKALEWMAEVMTGMSDNRESCFARVRQRLVVFKDRKEAAAHAKKEANEFWSAHVRPVRVM
jgi:hypothetical protein